MAVNFQNGDRGQYAGATLGTWEHNGYHDSDFYALVWDGETLTAREFGTTRGAGWGTAEADATDDIKRAAGEFLIERDTRAWVEATAIDSRTTEKGKQVEVVKGRKVPIGTTGEVVWFGEDNYKRGAYRIRIKTSDGGEHWTAESNVKVLNPEQYETDIVDIAVQTRQRVEKLIATGGSWEWVSAYRSYGGNMAAKVNDRTLDVLDAARASVENREDIIAAAIAMIREEATGDGCQERVTVHVPAIEGDSWSVPSTYEVPRWIANRDPDITIEVLDIGDGETLLIGRETERVA